MRSFNTSAHGLSFNQLTIVRVWQKGAVISDYDSAVWRRDRCGAPIKYSDFGNTNSEFGWEIDHTQPVAKHGSDDLGNLEPLQWRNNRHKSDNWPRWYCLIPSA